MNYSNINIQTDPNLEKIELLQSIHKYYPIGLVNFNDQYEGFKALKSILENKINRVIDKTLPYECYDLVSKLQKNFGVENAFDENHRQFPCYSYFINLREDKISNFRVVKLLKIKISLLVKFFTVFQETIILSIPGTLPKKNSIIYKIITEYENSDNGRAFLEKNINESFPSYKSIDYSLLLNTKIHAGIPFGLDHSEKTCFPIYAFLFDNDLEPFNYIVN